MRFLSPVRLAPAALLMLCAAGCGDGGGTNPPTAGTLVVSLATPAADDGAILVTITGPGVSSVQPANSTHRVFWRLVSAQEMRVIVVGQIAAGPLLSLNVADVDRASAYSAVIGEVAATNDQIRPSTAGYSLTVSR